MCLLQVERLFVGTRGACAREHVRCPLVGRRFIRCPLLRKPKPFGWLGTVERRVALELFVDLDLIDVGFEQHRIYFGCLALEVINGVALVGRLALNALDHKAA